MLQTKWIVFVVAVWIALTLVLCVVEGTTIDNSDENSPYYNPAALQNSTTLEQLQNLQVFKADDITSMATGLFSPDLWSCMASMLTLNYPGVFYGDWVYVRMVFLLPLVGGMVFTIVYSAIRMVRGGSGI
jgi:hypothetical protein